MLISSSKAMEIMSDTDLAALLNISDIKVTKTEIDSNGDFLIYADSTKNGTSCHGCGKETDKPYGYDRIRKIRHSPIFSRKCFIIIRFPRYLCCDCDKTTTQNVSWCNRNSPYTVDFEKHILLSLVNSTIEDVSVKQDIGYDAIESVIKRHIEGEVDWSNLKELSIIGIDEISLKKGHKDFVVIVTARTANGTHILAVLQDKEKETVKEFFLSIPKRLRKTVRFVCSDMYNGFINAAKEVFNKRVRIVIDRFHVAMLYRDNFESIRKKEMKRLKKELTDLEYGKLKNVMWILRRRVTDLTPEDSNVLQILFRHSPLLKMAYDFRNKLTDIFDLDLSKAQAKRKLRSWINGVKRKGLTCFDGFIKTLEKRLDDISNYFINRDTSGFVEGLNNKIKVIKRRCYGIFNVENLFRRTHLDLAGYKLFLQRNHAVA
jgi:transposase